MRSFREADAETLYSDGQFAVYWTGKGYGIKRERDGVAIGERTFGTIGLACDFIRSDLYPKQVA